jgi:peroxiredoxin Q/BCP
MSELIEGMKAPDFSLPSTEGKSLNLKDFRGQQVVLYFYPKDDTPGCTKEACSFRDSLARLKSKGAVVLGVSLDDIPSHDKFREKYNLSFPLLSDQKAEVSSRYGVYKQKNLYGNKFWGIERSTFIIDKDGTIKKIFRKVRVDGHVDEIMPYLS